jgi:hypothetical protein
MDGDGLANGLDNCPMAPNFSQMDTDGDVFGNACDDDDDGDGVLDIVDNCPLVSNPAQGDPSLIAGCDLDNDADGVLDSIDNCPEVANPDQLDTNGDLLGDLCDADADGDGIANALDNCASVANADQANADRDSMGDACDAEFCYVVDNPAACLNPVATFTVYGTPVVDFATTYGVSTGADVYLSMHANRGNTAVNYRWIVIDRPAGSNATVDNAMGATSYSMPGTFHTYTYNTGRAVTFSPDKPGTYTLKLEADLPFGDTEFPEVSAAEYELTIEAEGSPVGACSVNNLGAESEGALATVALLGLLGLAVVRRRLR